MYLHNGPHFHEAPSFLVLPVNASRVYFFDQTLSADSVIHQMCYHGWFMTRQWKNTERCHWICLNHLAVDFVSKVGRLNLNKWIYYPQFRFVQIFVQIWRYIRMVTKISIVIFKICDKLNSIYFLVFNYSSIFHVENLHMQCITCISSKTTNIITVQW